MIEKSKLYCQFVVVVQAEQEYIWTIRQYHGTFVPDTFLEIDPNTMCERETKAEGYK